MKFGTIEGLLDELRGSACRRIGGNTTRWFHVSAAMLNRVNEAIGGFRGACVDASPSGARDGSNLFMALMYQNLLLAARIEDIEDALEEAGIPCE